MLGLLAGPVAAQDPLTPPRTTFRPVGTVDTRLTAKSRIHWSVLYGCFCIVEPVIRSLTKEVGTPAFQVVKLLVWQPKSKSGWVETGRDFLTPWSDLGRANAFGQRK